MTEWVHGLRWLATVNQWSGRRWAALLVAWVVAAVLARVGIPTVNPTQMPTPRPLETLGIVALCLPAGLSGAMLSDQLPWLTATSPRGGHRLRLCSLAVVTLVTTILAGLWTVTLPVGIPKLNVAGVWLFLLALAVVGVVWLGNDFAVVPPFVAVVPFSIGGLVPFEANVIYNVERVDELLWLATILSVVAALAFASRGSKASG